MKQIKITKDYDSPTHLLRAGRSYTVSDELAELVVASGCGDEIVTEPKIETASLRPRTTRRRKPKDD